MKSLPVRVGLALLVVAGAVALVVQATRRGPARSQAAVWREAVSAATAGETERAEVLLDELLVLDPQHLEGRLLRAHLAIQAHDPERALALTRDIPDTEPQWAAKARYLEGMVFYEQARAVRAEVLFRKSVELNSHYLPPRESLLRICVGQLRADDIRRELEGLRTLRDWSPPELLLYVLAGDRTNSADAMIPQLRRQIAADPDDLASAAALGSYLLAENRLGEVVTSLLPIHRKHPEQSDLPGLIALDLLRISRFDEARELLNATGRRPDAAPWWKARAEYSRLRDDWRDVADSLRLAVALAPEDSAAWFQWGTALQKVGDGPAAERAIARARLLERLRNHLLKMQVSDDNPKPLIVAAEILTELGRPQEAVWFLEDAASLKNGAEAAKRLPAARGLAAKAPRSRPAVSIPTPSPLEPLAPAGSAPAVARGAAPVFQDIHEKLGLRFQFHAGGKGKKYLVETTGGGVAVLDYDRDGLPDLFFPQGADLPYHAAAPRPSDVLCANLGGAVRDVTSLAGLGPAGYGQGCTAADFDNDGFPDLSIAELGGLRLYRNRGDGTFEDVSARVPVSESVWCTSLAFADLDRDGDLDLYVVTYVEDFYLECQKPDRSGPQSCVPAKFGASPDLVFLNRGDGTFVESAAGLGLIGAEGRGLGIVVADFDDDGWPDVYVANDGSANFLFHNRGDSGGPKRFEEIGVASGAALSGEGFAQAGMGIACGDLDGVHGLDLYVTNFYDEYNTLYLNQERMTFEDRTRPAGLIEPTLKLLGFGTQALDADLDGRLDLFVANGHIEPGHSRGGPWKMPPQLFFNRGAAKFDDASRRCGPYFQGAWVGRGAARLDWNGDGRPDLVVVHQDRPAALLLNETPSPGGWLGLSLVGTTSNRDVVGARIVVRPDQGPATTHQVLSGDGYFARNDPRLAIGLGKSRMADVEIHWPSGTIQKVPSLPAGQWRTIVEP